MMNIIVAIIHVVGLKHAPKFIKMHHFDEHTNIFLGGAQPLPSQTPSSSAPPYSSASPPHILDIDLLAT